MEEFQRQPRPEKTAIIEEIRSRLHDAKSAFIVDFSGISVAASVELRSQLRECEATMFVARNRLVEKALEGKAYAPVWEKALRGSSAVIASRGDAVATAKLISLYHKENGVLRVKCGMLDERGLSAEEAAELAELPGKGELQGKLAATLAAPMQQLAGVLEQKKASIAYVLKAIQEKKEKEAA